MSRALLLERATDWTNQSWHERLIAAAALLRIHDFLPEGEFARIEATVRTDVEAARLRNAS